MIEEEQRPRYWMYTLILAMGTLAVILACAFLLPFNVVVLNASTFLSFPFGFYLTAQGVMIVLIVLVYWFAVRQAEIDRKFGATDDM